MDKNISTLVWIKSKKTGGAAIQFPDGSIASADKVKDLIFWRSVRLLICFGGWYRHYKSEWQKQVAAFVSKLTSLEKFYGHTRKQLL